MLERHAGGNLQRAVENLVQGQERKVQQKIMSRVNFLRVGADKINAIYLSKQQSFGEITQTFLLFHWLVSDLGLSPLVRTLELTIIKAALTGHQVHAGGSLLLHIL